MQMIPLSIHRIKSIKFSIAIALLLTIWNYAQSQDLPEEVGAWNQVSGFSVGKSEDYIVLSFKILGKYQLYESKLINGSWSEPTPIESINKHHGEGFDIEGPSLNFNDQVLYFHANFPDSKGGYDIYYSLRSGQSWGEPKSFDNSINSSDNEMYPSITPGANRLFFSRSAQNPDFKKPKDTPECQKIFMSNRNPQGNWSEPIMMHYFINKGCEHSPNVAIDGKTIVFASVDESNYKEGFNINFTREIMEDNWLDAQAFISSEHTNIAPQIVGNYVYFLRKYTEKREEFSKIYRIKIPDQVRPIKTVTSKGRIVALADQKPLDAQLTVFDPTTLQELGRFFSNKQTGDFEMPLLDNANYIVDVRKHGYSFSSFMIDLRKEEKELAPEIIKLFEEIDLEVTVFDKENFRPISADLFVEDANDSSKKFTSEMISEGVYTLSLPIGNEYVVKANKVGFEDNSFNFNLTGDIVFSRFDRNLSLAPIRKLFEILITDAETQEDIAAEVLITNLNREEVMVFSAEDIKNGKVEAMLREGDQYEFTVRGAQGYSFFNQVVDLQKEEKTEIKAELVSLKEETSIRLNNINFSTSSADLSSESFPELNRVVQLITDNPSLVIEIAAHSDNVGNANFNKLLSERRAQSVVNYLLDNGVPQNQLVAKGYGLTQPMVPNTSDENRALNRRVEFKIINVMEEQEESIQ